MIDGQEKGLKAFARDWESIGGTFEELLEGMRDGDQGTLKLAAGYGATESLKACTDAFYTIMEMHESAQAGTLRPGASLAEIEAFNRRQEAEHQVWVRDMGHRMAWIRFGLGDPGPRAALQATAPTLLSEPRPVEPPAWHAAYALWVGPGRGNAAGFLALTKQERVELLGYDGPMPSRAELAEHDARQAWTSTGGDAADFDQMDAGHRQELIRAFGG